MRTVALLDGTTGA